MSQAIPLHRMLKLRIVLEGSEPAIWRTVEMDDGIMLDEAGLALQCAMGWEHAHLQAFHSASPYGYRGTDHEPTTWYEEQSRLEIGVGEPQETTTLDQALNASGGELFFEYDFGDCWMHKVTVESCRDMIQGEAPYRVVDGQLRAPLEDSGGILGWYDKLSILNGGPAPDYMDAQEVAEWMHWRGGRFYPLDPGEFRVDIANRRLEMLATQFVGSNGLGRWFGSMEPELRRALSVPAAQIGLGLEPVGTEVPPWFIELLHPFAVLTELCCEPVKLSAAGWMPPKIVGQLAQRAQLEGIDHESATTKRENNMITVFRLREAAVRMGLLRKTKGVLTATQRGRKLVDDPLGLARYVARQLAQYTGRNPQDRDIESDATFSDWLIRTAGFIPDKVQRHGKQPELFMDVSEILEMFGYWDPNLQRPISSESWLPRLQAWYLIEHLLRHRLYAQGLSDQGQERLAELSRYLLQE